MKRVFLHIKKNNDKMKCLILKVLFNFSIFELASAEKHVFCQNNGAFNASAVDIKFWSKPANPSSHTDLGVFSKEHMKKDLPQHFNANKDTFDVPLSYSLSGTLHPSPNLCSELHQIFLFLTSVLSLKDNRVTFSSEGEKRKKEEARSTFCSIVINL